MWISGAQRPRGDSGGRFLPAVPECFRPRPCGPCAAGSPFSPRALAPLGVAVSQTKTRAPGVLTAPRRAFLSGPGGRSRGARARALTPADARACARVCVQTPVRAPARPVPPNVRGADALLRAPRRPRLLAGLGIPPAAEGSQAPPFVAGFLVCPMPLHVHLGPHLGVKENPVGTRPLSQGRVRLPRRQPQPPPPQVTSHCGRVAEPEATVLPLHGS